MTKQAFATGATALAILSCAAAPPAVAPIKPAAPTAPIKLGTMRQIDPAVLGNVVVHMRITGPGTVTSGSATCISTSETAVKTCSFQVTKGEWSVMHGKPAAGHLMGVWTGCPGAYEQCYQLYDAETTVAVKFGTVAPPTVALNVLLVTDTAHPITLSSTPTLPFTCGSGQVIADGPDPIGANALMNGLNAVFNAGRSICTVKVEQGTKVSLTATVTPAGGPPQALKGYLFIRDCIDHTFGAACTLTMDKPHNVEIDYQ